MVQCQYHTPNDTIDVQSIVFNVERLISKHQQVPEGLPHKCILALLPASTFSMIERVCCSLKHHKFASEREWRCYSTLGRHTPLVVPSKGNGKRFVEMPFVAKEVIKEVVMSPDGGTRADRVRARDMKESKGLHCEITESVIPFRL